MAPAPTASAPTKPLLWLLEEATPEVALLMHHLERSLAGAATVQRVSYTDALRQLPHDAERGSITAIVAFSLGNVANVAKLLKGLPHPRPKLCFLPRNTESLSELRAHQRWAIPVYGVARHLGEAAILAASGFKAEAIVRLNGEIVPSALPDVPLGPERPLKVGLAWYNMSGGHQEAVTAEIRRWQASAPDRCEWHVFHLPDTAMPEWGVPGVKAVPVEATVLASPPAELDVMLLDPWWADGQPRPFVAPVQLFVAPGGGLAEPWAERLQVLLDKAGAAWSESQLLAFKYQPLWRSLLHDEERELPAVALADTAVLVAIRERLQAWLETELPAAEAIAGCDPADLAYYHWCYDLRVQSSWCLDLWGALAGAKNGERHALLLAINALGLHHATSSWLFKRLMARTTVAKQRSPRRSLPRQFWGRFVLKHWALVIKWLRTLSRLGKDDAGDPLAMGREMAAHLLAAAGVTINRANEPAPVPGVPVIYLFSHRHGELDPFLLLHALPGHLAIVVGPRAQRWPLIARLGHSSAFVLTGRERGVVIADAIAAVRSRRSLALYPEVAEPTYLGEASPFRSGLLWIVQALEKCQVIPVVLDDAFTLGPDGGAVDVWFGEPIVCTPETCEGLFDRVRMVFLDRLPRTRKLDSVAWVDARVPAASPPSDQVELVQPTDLLE